MVSISEVWKRILQNEGEVFKTKRGVSFTYTVKEDMIIPHPEEPTKRFYSDEVMRFKKTHVEKAITKIPIKSYNELVNILSIPIWLYAILTDTRIIPELNNIYVYHRSIFKKMIRWNAQTREYETLYLNDLNQTKEEYEEFRKDFFKEHGYYP